MPVGQSNFNKTTLFPLGQIITFSNSFLLFLIQLVFRLNNFKKIMQIFFQWYCNFAWSVYSLLFKRFYFYTLPTFSRIQSPGYLSKYERAYRLKQFGECDNATKVKQVDCNRSENLFTAAVGIAFYLFGSCPKEMTLYKLTVDLTFKLHENSWKTVEIESRVFP